MDLQWKRDMRQGVVTCLCEVGLGCGAFPWIGGAQEELSRRNRWCLVLKDFVRRSLTKMVTNNVTVYQFEVGLDEVFADEVRFHVNVDCVIVVVVKDCLFFMSFILCENCEFVKWMCWMLAFKSEL